MKDDDIRDMMDKHAFFAELERVCPEARDGVDVVGSVGPMSMSHAQLADILSTLPDNAGIDLFVRACRAATSARPEARVLPPSQGGDAVLEL
jgi:hypothetical protein